MDAAHRQAFGALLHQLRTNRGLSQAALAEAITRAGHPTSGSNVGAWERGQYGPATAEVVRAIAQALETEPDGLLDAAGYPVSAVGILDRVADLEARVLSLETLLNAQPGAKVVHVRESDLDDLPAAAATGRAKPKGRRVTRPQPPIEEDPET